jgi:hypothetical protein
MYPRPGILKCGQMRSAETSVVVTTYLYDYYYYYYYYYHPTPNNSMETSVSERP